MATPNAEAPRVVRGFNEAPIAGFGRFDIAVANAAVVFLASDESSFMTSADSLIDRGYRAR